MLFRNLFISFLLVNFACIPAISQTFNEKPNQSYLKNVESLSNNEFLPFQDAYKLSVNFSDDVLNFDWEIADGYYLYKAKINVFAHDANTQIHSIVFSESQNKFDEFFNENIEVDKVDYYYTNVIARASNTMTECRNLRENFNKITFSQNY